jgi:hypothetical protein
MSQNDIIAEYERQVQINSAAYQQCLAEYTAAQASGDRDSQDNALQNMAGLRATRVQIDQMAREALNVTANTAPGNQYGLSKDEQDVAEKSFSGANFGWSKERMHQEYARQKAKLHSMRASGEYRQTTDATG